MKPHEKHRHGGPETLKVDLVTVSSSRYAMKSKGAGFVDESGDVAEGLTKKMGNVVARRNLVDDDVGMICDEVEAFLVGEDDVLVFMGGTGVSKRDVTIEAVTPYLEKELDGFGELLRAASYEEIGAAAMMTRAKAGVAKGKLVVCLPGSPGAAKTALERFMPEFPHALFVARS